MGATKKESNDEEDKHPFYSTDAFKRWEKRCLELERIEKEGHKKIRKEGITK